MKLEHQVKKYQVIELWNDLSLEEQQQIAKHYSIKKFDEAYLRKELGNMLINKTAKEIIERLKNVVKRIYLHMKCYNRNSGEYQQLYKRYGSYLKTDMLIDEYQAVNKTDMIPTVQEVTQLEKTKRLNLV